MKSKTFLYNGNMDPSGASKLDEAIKYSFSFVASITCLLYTSPVVVLCHSEDDISEENAKSIQGLIDDFVA